ncbi:MAG: deoxyribose-phosphate aldolase [Treponema sp.]|nr:deoxyribose-phosphate aldolase [Treponema sp.]
MTDQEILHRIDHTLLKAVSSWAEIDKLCAEAVEFKTASVCVPPSYVRSIRQAYRELNVCTVIGFPLGYNSSAVKLKEAEIALAEGAGELDMVINLGDLKNRFFDRVEAEIFALKKITGKKILKVIVETCYLEEEEKIRLCKIVSQSGADYIKTSTGFGTAGAVFEDVLLFKKHITETVKIKAAGGIKTREDLVKFIEAGCDRIGTSSAVALLTGGPAGSY